MKCVSRTWGQLKMGFRVVYASVWAMVRGGDHNEWGLARGVGAAFDAM